MSWLNEVWTWADRLIRQGGATSEAVWLVILVLAVVLLGSWAQSRIAQS